jgi:hypothetical protein
MMGAAGDDPGCPILDSITETGPPHANTRQLARHSSCSPDGPRHDPNTTIRALGFLLSASKLSF